MASSPKVGLIFGQQDSAEVQFIANEIERQGHIPLLVDGRNISRGISIEYNVAQDALCLDFTGRKVSMKQISGVYWASIDSPRVCEPTGAKSAAVEARNSRAILQDLVTKPNMDYACLLQLLFAQSQVNWVNSFEAVKFHRIKPKQLSLARSLGANIAPTYIGNCPFSMHEFLCEHPSAIVKPVFTGGLTKRLPPEACSLAEIKKWATHPVTLQGFVAGDNVRTYIIGNFMVSALIEECAVNESALDAHAANVNSQTASLISDYREADGVKLRRIELPIATAQLAMRIMRAFRMQYTAIDWRLTPLGEYYFLEANPAPLFVEAQQQLGIDMDKAIVELMFA